MPSSYNASSPMHSSKPDPLVAVKHESTISSTSFFLALNSTLFLVVGALATRYHTTLYMGALAAILSIFLGSLLLLLHKVMDSSKKSLEASQIAAQANQGYITHGDNTGTGWRDRLHQNLWDGVYPPNQKLGSVLGMVLVTILWGISTCITIEYHILLKKGHKQTKIIRQGPLSSWGELSFSAFCTVLSFILVIIMVVQRRLTSKEMQKAICSQELEY